ncbi:MAG: peptidoglycan-binding protein [Alphaproteobacteria bacterium]|nr:peptidoglycan-binding protein [Alphaproteobacteria bacterium]
MGNRGEASFRAPIFIRHQAQPRRLRLIDAGSAEWRCQTGSGQLHCARQQALLAAKARTRYSVTVFVPRDVRRRRIRVCANIDWQRPGALRERTRTVQRLLLSEGYKIGRPDGAAGPATRGGIAQYQADEGLRVTGRIDRALMEELTDEWGVGDARANNDRTCVQARVRDGGSFEREPNVLPAPDQSNRATQSDTGGRRLRCPPSRIQEGRTCVCRPGLIEDETGACLAGSGTAPEPKPEIDRSPLPDQQAACSAGRRRTTSGECVCLPGRVEQNGRCVIPRQQASCTGGKERNSAGRCACPRGLRDIDGLCQVPQDTSPAPKPKKKVIKKQRKKKAKPAPDAPKTPAKSSEETQGNACKNNMILNENGKCQCYLNLKNSSGKCLVKVRAKCLPGEVINVRGKCECPKNREIRDGKCVLRQN